MTAEQEARDMLERLGVEGAQEYSSGDLVELANLIAFRHEIELAITDSLQIDSVNDLRGFIAEVRQEDADQYPGVVDVVPTFCNLLDGVADLVLRHVAGEDIRAGDLLVEKRTCPECGAIVYGKALHEHEPSTPSSSE